MSVRAHEQSPVVIESRTRVADDTGYAWYVVGVLTVIYTLSFIDRQILTLLFTPIKRDLDISDTQVSLLSGLAFAVLYALLGVPIARLADRHNRVTLIAAGMVLWSFMTALCGLARNFWQLFACRVGVGIGEATLSPSAYSLIADYFPAHKLGRALSVYTLAVYFGMGSALLVGSAVVALVQHLPTLELSGVGVIRDWQLALILVGLPGLLLIAVLLTVREPRRGQRKRESEVEAAVIQESVFRFLARHWRIYAPHFAGFSVLGVLGNGIATWVPELFLRAYAWPVERTGVAFGLILMTCGGTGLLLGGWYADRLRTRGVIDAPLRIAAAAVVPLGICGVLMPISESPYTAIALLGIVIFCFSVPGGLAPASLQMVTPDRMRARVSAVYLLCTTLIGTGFGPTAVAITTDYVLRDEAALGRSLSLVAACTAPLGLLLLTQATRPFRQAVSALAAHPAATR